MWVSLQQELVALQSLLTLTGERYAALQAATRKVVEALRIARQYVTPFTYDMEQCDLALADPTIVALRRE
jgi:hypothetical protein